MATESAADIREETARELERIRREVDIARDELRVRFEYYFQMLRDKHLELVAQLDDVVRVAETQAEKRQVKLNQLIVTKAEVSHNLQHNELNETLVNVSRELDGTIRGLEADVDLIPSIWLEWRDGWLEGGIAKLCRLCEGVSYVNRHRPVWSGVSEGEGQIGLTSPYCLSIDRENGDIYVCDFHAARIQVFLKEGSYSRTIEPQGLSMPINIIVSLHYLFVSFAVPLRICKLDKVSGDILCRVVPGHVVHSLSVDTNILYAGLSGINGVSHLNMKDLWCLNMTLLNSPHITQDTRLRDLKLAPSLFIVLFHESPYPVQSFSRDGNLIHSIVSQEHPIAAWHFCLDRHMNIIVSNYGTYNVKVFNGEGLLIASIGQRGTGAGEFQDPRGIDINKEGLIVVADIKESHMLQFF